MNTDNQWFNPGDKVMQVNDNCPPGAVTVRENDIQYGVVYCVKEFWTDCGINWIDLVGFPTEYDPIDGERIAWTACNFRRVDEIKLCVAAAKHIKQREEELV